MNRLTYWLYAYQQSLPADYYIVRLVDATANRKTQPRRYPYQSFLGCAQYLRHMNSQGYHVYCRPEGYEYVLIDDIPRNQLSRLLELKPALATETSPGNFQAFLRLPYVPRSREQATTVCQTVCHVLNGDLGSAEPDHLGRLPGFFNLKPKYRSEKGTYPTVVPHHALDQFTVFSPHGPKAGGGVSTPSRMIKNTQSVADRSREDFALACRMVWQRKSDDDIRLVLSQREKGMDRPKYVEITIQKAREAVKKEQL